MSKLKVAFYNLSGCSGCLLSIINCEDSLLDIFNAANVVSFLMAQSNNREEEQDLAFLDGSVTTDEQEEFLLHLRPRTKKVVALGTCACYGGVQAMENAKGTFERRFEKVYGKTPFTIVKAFESKPVDAVIPVDYYIPGCPIDGDLFLYNYARLLKELPVDMPKTPVCRECKWQENECLLLKNQLCLGPVTAGGCKARCPSHNLPCIGCFGPADEANLTSEFNLLKEKGYNFAEIERKLRLFGGTKFINSFRELWKSPAAKNQKTQLRKG
ncbi:MAG: NADH:ubiquinone oxidoreductase [candidate division WOR-3 bacterium]